jgi:hypothetical protein
MDYFTKWVEVIPTGFVLEELGETLLLKPLHFGNKKSVGGIVLIYYARLILGVLIYYKVK